MDENLSSKRYEPPSIDLNDKNSSQAISIDLIGSNKHLLEIGTSTGYVTKILREKGNIVTGIEKDREAGSIAKQYCDKIIIGDIEHLNLDKHLEPSSFDVILLGDIIEHLEEPANILKKVKKYLKSDGYLVVSIPNFCHGDVLLNIINGDFHYQSSGLLDQTHLRFFGLKNIFSLFSECGYEISNLRTTNLDIGKTELSIPYNKIPQTLIKFIRSLPNSDVYQFIFVAHPAAKIIPPVLVEPDINKLVFDSFEEAVQKIRSVLSQEIEKNQMIEKDLVRLQEDLSISVNRMNNLNKIIQEKESQISFLNEQNHQLLINNQNIEKELRDINNSATWQLVTKFHQNIIERFFLKGTKRREAYDCGLKGIRILMNKGVMVFLSKSTEYINKSNSKQPEYLEWILNSEPSTEDLVQQKHFSKNFTYCPLISIITPVYDPPQAILESTIRSVLEQTYDNWELCIVDGNSKNPNIQNILKNFSNDDPRIKIKILEENRGISGNSNAALSIASGEFIAFLDHDDTLAPFALFEVVKALNKNRDLDFIYSDRDLLSEEGKYRFNPLFKPDWSPDLMFSANYLTHLCVIRKSLVDQLGGLLPETDGAQDWDIFFRTTEKTNRIYHIPSVLYHWRFLDSSCSKRGSDAKPYVMNAQKISLENHIHRLRLSADVAFEESGFWRIKWGFDSQTKVSIIIPSKDIQLLKMCIESIINLTMHKNYEIIVINLGIDKSIDPDYYQKLFNNKLIQLLPCPNPSNCFSAKNEGAQHASGELLLFLEENLKVISPDWISEMGGWSIQDAIGVVGAKIIYPNKKIYCAGGVLGLNGFVKNTFEDTYEGTMGPFGSSEWYRNYLVMNGACMMMKREIFEKMGGFDTKYAVFCGDSELMVKLWETGYRNIYTPFAQFELTKQKPGNTASSEQDLQIFYEGHKQLIENGDPYFNKNLSYVLTKLKFRHFSDKKISNAISDISGKQSNKLMILKKIQQLKLIIQKSICFIKKNGMVAFIHRVRNEVRFRADMPNIVSSPQPKNVSELLNDRFASTISRPLRIYHAPIIKPRLNLITDSINEGSLFGGVATAIIFSALLAEKWGCDLRVITRTEKAKEGNFGKILKLNNVSLTKNVEFIFANIHSEKDEVDVSSEDIFLTTSWWTTKSVLQSLDASQIIYLLQEDERMFYPYNDDHLMCTEVLRNNRLKYVINTQLLYDHFVSEGFLNIRENGIWFEPSFNPKSLYIDNSRVTKKVKKSFFFYARPNHPRNLFYLGLEVIAKAVEKKIIDINEWDIYFVGGDIPQISICTNYYPIIVPNMDWENYCTFVRKMDLGFCLMYTPHPSYPPLDLAACGAVVVTNSFENKSDLTRYSKNIICKEANLESLLQGLEEGVSLAENTELRVQNYKENRLLRDWERSFFDVIHYLSKE